MSTRRSRRHADPARGSREPAGSAGGSRTTAGSAGDSRAPAGSAGGGATPSPTPLLTVLVIADVAYAFQQTAVIPAIPTVQSALHTTQAWSAWLLSAYLMVATVATPALGRLADIRGTKNILVASLGIFFLGSVAAAAAPGIGVLVVARALQGVGGVVFPLSFAVTRASWPRERVGWAIGLLTGAFGVGSALGFGVGGLLAGVLSWRSIFAVGAVAVGAAAVLVWRMVPRFEGNGGPFDGVGTALMGAASVALILALTLGVQLGWASPVTIVVFVVSVLAGAGWARAELRSRVPIVDLAVLRNRSVLLVNLATLAVGWAMFGAFFLLPELVQGVPARVHYGFGAGAAATGLFLLPAAVGQFLAGPAARPLTERFSARRVLATGLLLLAAALAVLAVTTQSVAQVAVATFVLGFGAGLAVQTTSAVATEAVEERNTGVSAALNATIRRLAGGVGAQVSAVLLAALVTGSGHPTHSAFVVAFATAGALALVGAALTARHPRAAA